MLNKFLNIDVFPLFTLWRRQLPVMVELLDLRILGNFEGILISSVFIIINYHKFVLNITIERHMIWDAIEYYTWTIWMFLNIRTFLSCHFIAISSWIPLLYLIWKLYYRFLNDYCNEIGVSLKTKYFTCVVILNNY